jgi:hypothetical protein
MAEDMELWEKIIIGFLFFSYIAFLIWYVRQIPFKFLKFQLKTIVVVIIGWIIDPDLGCSLIQIVMLYWFYKLHKHDDWDD